MERFQVICELGHGGVASAYLCRELATDRLVAIKRIPLHRVQSAEQKRRLIAEQFVLSHASHPYLCQGIESIEDGNAIGLVMEYIEDARPLYQCVWRYQSTSAFPESVVKYFTVQIVLALEELHRIGYIHRDLKSGNILVDKRGVAKVIDFGFAKKRFDSESQVEPGEHQRTYSICGTHYIMAPEMYLRQPYGEAVDWWAVGVIVHEMVCGRPPWDYQPKTAQAATTFFDKISEVAKGCSLGKHASPELAAADVSEECRSFVRELLVFNPRKRLGSNGGAMSVKAHPWFSDVSWDANEATTSPYDPIKDYRSDGSTAPQVTVVSSSSSADSIDPEDNARFFDDF